MVKVLRSRSEAPDRGANFVFEVPHFGQFAVRMVGQCPRDSPLRDDGRPFNRRDSVPTPSTTQQALIQGGGREAKVEQPMSSQSYNGSQPSLLSFCSLSFYDRSSTALRY